MNWKQDQQTGPPSRASRARLAALLCAAVVFLAGAPVSANTSDALANLKALSLEELVNVEVTIANKAPTRVADVASAVFVITSDDIRRTGATSIPEVLRMVPGIQVARIDTRIWAVSIRGFNARFSNKLLLQIDGRTQYTTLYAGVYWDLQDLVMEDVDRIEVIRGPGATLWGSNAVNGVINIITRSADSTRGNLLVVDTGEHGAAAATFRHGGALGQSGSYRAYIKAARQDSPFADPNPQDNHNYQRRQAGFRMDWRGSDQNQLMLLGDIYDNSIDQLAQNYFLTPPYLARSPAQTTFKGGNLQFRWARDGRSGSRTTFQAYIDHQDRREVTISNLAGQTGTSEENVLDLDFQRSTDLSESGRLVWGTAYRRTDTRINIVDPPDRIDQLYSAFVQVERGFFDSRLSVTAGTKFEHNDYSGFEVQPSLRGLWYLSPKARVWGAVSRAVRRPSRGEHNIALMSGVLPPGSSLNPTPVPIFLPFQGNPEFDSEKAVTWEAGFRTMQGENLSIDLALFHTNYQDLRTVESGEPEFNLFGSEPFVSIPSFPANLLEGSSRGIELSANWQVTPTWQLRGAYSFLDLDLKPDPATTDIAPEQAEGQSPRHQLSLRSSVSLTETLNLEAWYRLVDELPNLSTSVVNQGIGIPSYSTLDLRLAWRPRPSAEVSLGVNNLLGSHAEFSSEFFGSTPERLDSSAFVRLAWQF